MIITIIIYIKNKEGRHQILRRLGESWKKLSNILGEFYAQGSKASQFYRDSRRFINLLYRNSELPQLQNQVS